MFKRVRSRPMLGLLVGLAMVAGLASANFSAHAVIRNGINLNFSGGGSTGEYHVFSDGVDTAKPFGALLQFHGDGAYEFKNPSSSYSLGGNNGIVEAAKKHNLVTIAMLTPDESRGTTWWQKGSANADYVDAFIKDVVYKEMEIDPTKVWLVGYSGGAQFITQYYLPKYPNTIKGGGSIVFGGGGEPEVKAGTFPDELKSNFPMHWCTGSKDTASNSGEGYDALGYARDGESYYKSIGMATSIETPNAGHNLDGTFGGVVAEQLAAHGSNTQSNIVQKTESSSPAALEVKVSSASKSANIEKTIAGDATRKPGQPEISARLNEKRVVVLSGKGWAPNSTIKLSSDIADSQTYETTSDDHGTFEFDYSIPSTHYGPTTFTARY